MASWITRRRVIGLVAGLVAAVALVFGVVTGYPLVLYSSYVAYSDSMEPTIPEGTNFWARSADGRALHDGQIVLLRPPDMSPPFLGVIRVVARGGQTVSARDGRLMLDGRPAVEPYLAAGTTTRTFAAVTVPTGAVFVLGDNRARSIGSDVYGPVPVADVRAVVVDVDEPSDWALIVRAGLALLVALIGGLLCWRLVRTPRPRRHRYSEFQ